MNSTNIKQPLELTLFVENADALQRQQKRHTLIFMRKDTASILGESVGHIRVINLIGEGGMGAVYAGFDDKLERHVALKAIHSDFKLNPQSKARFLREARILSQLDHPGICTIHDYVEGESNDFLVMELIDGRNLRKALGRGLSGDKRLEIAREILEVLVEVHGQGVIHRDLKPENIMITSENRIKVLDFGLSRSAEEDAAFTHAETLSPDESPTLRSGESVYVKTTLGTIIGTASYMSPEQARGEPATAASDMYSVGLVFQELFTGRRPFEEGLDSPALLEKAAGGESLPVDGLPFDLTVLINRLKSFAPGARPSSVDAFEQLQAIIGKPRRRRRRTLIAAVWLVLAVFGLGMAAQWFRASREARRAEAGEQSAQQEAKTARRAADFMVNLFVASTPHEARGEDVSARELLDRGAARVDRDLADEPLIQARLMRSIGMAYRELGLYEQATPLLERAVEIYRNQLGDDHVETAGSLYHLASLIQEEARYGDAKRLYVEALAILEKHLEADDLKIADTYAALGTIDFALQSFEDCETSLRRSIKIYENVLGKDDPNLSVPLGMLAASFDVQGKYEEAEVLSRRVLEIREKTLDPNHPLIAAALNDLAVNCWYQEKYGEAEQAYGRSLAIYRYVYEPHHPLIAMVIGNLGELYWKTGNLSAAESHLQDALEILIENFGPDHPDVAYTENVLANFYSDQSRYSEAEALFLSALGAREQTFGPTHPSVEETLRDYSRMLKMAGRVSEAEGAFARAEAILASTEPE